MKKIVLMYHDVYSSVNTESGFQFPTSFPYKIDAKEFERHVEFAYNYCKKRNYQLDSIEFSFDDGGESFYRVIAPILEKYGFKGLFFISTKFIGLEKFLTIEQIKSLHKRGHVIASHSHSHPRNMTKLTKQEISNEWKDSIEILEEIIQSPITTASIPSGYSSQEVFNAATKFGIKTLYTSKPTEKVSTSNSLTIIGRYVVHCNTSLSTVSKIISSGWYRKMLLCKWRLIYFAKKILGSNYNIIKNRIIR